MSLISCSYTFKNHTHMSSFLSCLQACRCAPSPPPTKITVILNYMLSYHSATTGAAPAVLLPKRKEHLNHEGVESPTKHQTGRPGGALAQKRGTPAIYLSASQCAMEPLPIDAAASIRASKKQAPNDRKSSSSSSSRIVNLCLQPVLPFPPCPALPCLPSGRQPPPPRLEKTLQQTQLGTSVVKMCIPCALRQLSDPALVGRKFVV